jgi:hypothetical protein
MRRREKFVITSAFLSFGLLAVQYVPLEWRYIAVGLFTLLTYGLSGWALSNDLQRHELATILPLPSYYSLAVSLFYFLLPETWVSRLVLIGLFAVGMYALLLTANIFSVAKGRTIQLIHAAHAVGMLFTLLISLLLSNTLYSLHLPFYVGAALVALIHAPLILISVWSVQLEPRVSRQLVVLSVLFTIILLEVSLVLSFFPFSVWDLALFTMSFLYLGLGVLHNFLRGRLFQQAIREYVLVALLVTVLFLVRMPGK